MVALHQFATKTPQNVVLLLRLDPLGQHLEAQAAAHAEYGRGDRPVIHVEFQIADERTVDLQLAYRKAFQISER